MSSIKDIARSYIAGYADLTGRSTAPILHPDARVRMMHRSYGLPLPREMSGSEYLALFPGMAELLPFGIRHEVRSLIAEGDVVAVETECHADLGGGRAYANAFHFRLVIRDGRVVSVHEYTDFLHTKEALFDPVAAGPGIELLGSIDSGIELLGGFGVLAEVGSEQPNVPDDGSAVR